jgi:hypothetical protein
MISGIRDTMQDLYLIAIQSIEPEDLRLLYENSRPFIACFGFFLAFAMARWVLEQ